MSAADIERLAATADKLRQTIEDTAKAWPQPTEIKADLPPAPEFDGTTLLPQVLREFVLDEADRMPCSPDFVAVALVCALGAVIGARCAIKPKRRDDWIVTPNLFGGVVGEPSSKKTPGINTALRFLDRLEAKEAERHAERMKAHEAEMAAFEARQSAIQGAMKKAASGKGDGVKMDCAVADLQALVPPEEPRQRRFKTNDATVAKIGDILVGSPAGLMVFRDELVGLLASWEREGNEGDRAFYLEGFNGTGSFNIDRIGRGSLFVKTVCLSVFGGIQPELLERYLSNIVNSMDNDGRIQRFQMLVYPEQVPWAWRDRYPVKGAREAVRDVFDHLADFDPEQDGAAPADDFMKLPHFHFDEAAQELFIEWSTDLHINRIASEENPLMRQHLAKFEKLFCCAGAPPGRGACGASEARHGVAGGSFVRILGRACPSHLCAGRSRQGIDCEEAQPPPVGAKASGRIHRARRGSKGLDRPGDQSASRGGAVSARGTRLDCQQRHPGKRRPPDHPALHQPTDSRGEVVIDWMARARVQLEQSGQGGTARTAETGVLSVSSAPGGGATQKCGGVSSVLSVAVPAFAAINVGAGAPIQVRAANDGRMGASASAQAANRGNPHMTPQEGDECHAGGWNDAEIETFIARAKRFALLGRADGEHLAERLTLRDRDGDDRRLCLECSWLSDTGRCLAAATGRIPSADRRLEPVQTILQRCAAFGLRKCLA